MIYLPGDPLPSHLVDLVPLDVPAQLYQVHWYRGSIQIGIMIDDFDSIEPVAAIPGISVEDNERHAVEMAYAGFLVGYAEHRLQRGIPVSDEEIVEALAAATMRGDLAISDLLDAAVGRGIGPVDPAPVVSIGGYRH